MLTAEGLEEGVRTQSEVQRRRHVVQDGVHAASPRLERYYNVYRKEQYRQIRG